MKTLSAVGTKYPGMKVPFQMSATIAEFNVLYLRHKALWDIICYQYFVLDRTVLNRKSYYRIVWIIPLRQNIFNMTLD